MSACSVPQSVAVEVVGSASVAAGQFVTVRGRYETDGAGTDCDAVLSFEAVRPDGVTVSLGNVDPVNESTWYEEPYALTIVGEWRITGAVFYRSDSGDLLPGLGPVRSDSVRVSVHDSRRLSVPDDARDLDVSPDAAQMTSEADTADLDVPPDTVDLEVPADDIDTEARPDG